MSANIRNNTRNYIDLRLSNSDFYDFYLTRGVDSNNHGGNLNCEVIKYDFNDPNIFSGSTNGEIYSTETWSGATNDGYILPTFGLTGLDNGKLLYDKISGDTANNQLVSILTGTTLIITSGDTRLSISPVSGSTTQFEYPIEIKPNSGGTEGQYATLCGGFYQGFYKLDGYSYEVLPNRVSTGWVANVWLRKRDESICTNTGTTLNDVYPNNEGLFLYFGTRAENKFWNEFEGLNTGATSACTSGATEWCTITKENEVSFIDENGDEVLVGEKPNDYIETDNKFLSFNRTPTGFTACNYSGQTFNIIHEEPIVKLNQFLIYNRTTTGETACSYSGDTNPDDTRTSLHDISDNAIGFRITSDGRIGYRKLVVTGACIDDVSVSGCSIVEEYSEPNIINDDEWYKISVRFKLNKEYLDCDLINGKRRKGRLMFYVDGRLKFVVNEFDEFIANRLDDHKDKQVGVPYNISIGGGTQGLLESMTFDGQDPDDLDTCVVNNFGGSFIGDVSQFTFDICDKTYCEIMSDYKEEKSRYGK